MQESEYKSLKKGIIDRYKAGDTAALSELERLEKLWMTQMDHESIRQKNVDEVQAKVNEAGLKASIDQKKLQFEKDKFEQEQKIKEAQFAWEKELEMKRQGLEFTRIQNEAKTQQAERRNKTIVAVIGAVGGVATAATTIGVTVYKETQKNKRVDAISAFESTGSATSLVGKSLLNEGLKD